MSILAAVIANLDLRNSRRRLIGIYDRLMAPGVAELAGNTIEENMPKRRDYRRSILVLLRGAVLIAVATAICYLLKLHSAPAALVFLVAVVIQSLDCTFPEAVITCLLAVASLDYFLMDPPFSFVINESVDLVTLFCLIASALIVTHIQSSSRAQALESLRQKQNMQRLYEAAQELLALPPQTASGSAILRPFLRVFPMQAACIFDAESAETHLAGSSLGDLAPKTRDAYIFGNDLEEEEKKIVVHCLRARGRLVGAIGFEGLPDTEHTSNAMAALAAAVLERSRAFQAAADAAAQARAEMLRSAILDALAHEIKTPLAVILASAGGMRAAGEMKPEQAELAELIETEAARLGDLTTSLLRVARLDTEELRPRLQIADPVELAARAARRYGKVWPNREIRVRRDGDTGEVRVDPDLMLLAISQLVENACRYAPKNAAIDIGIASLGEDVALTVANDGRPIPAEERERIFERFYRGIDARQAGGGTGLGLFVARKIARAHGGDLVLADGGPARVAFRLTIRQETRETILHE
jgi:two-component system sensor histidine kinase KdpD